MGADEKHIEITNRIAEEEKLQQFKVKIEKIQFAGNYLGEVFYIEINGKDLNDNKKVLKLFMKCAPKPGPFRDIHGQGLNDYYRKEIFTYTNLKEHYNKLQADYGVPEEEQYVFPKLYKYNVDENCETVIFEDLKSKGYIVPKRTELPNLSFIAKGIKTIANFHALSFALEKDHPDFFDEHIKCLKESLFMPIEDKALPEDKDILIKEGMQKTIDSIDPRHREVFRKWCNSEEFSKIPGKTIGSKRESMALCHGDLKIDNVFIRPAKGGEVKDMILIDYQTIYYGSIVNDFIFFIMLTTDSKQRRNHFEEWVQLYYDTLKEFTKYFKIDFEELYPKKDYQLDLKECLPFGLYLATLWYHLIFIDPDNKDQKSFIDTLDTSPGFNNVFRERMNGAVADFVLWGYL